MVYTAVTRAHERRVANQDRYPRRVAEHTAAHAAPAPVTPGARRAGDAAQPSGRLAAGRGLDIAALKAAWKTRCAELGVDPAVGPTAYQVEFATGALRWPRHLRQDWLRYVPLAKREAMGGRDRFENERFAAIEREARARLRMIDPEPADAVAVSLPTLRELWAEVRRELRLGDVALHDARAVQLVMEGLLAEIDRLAALTEA